MSYFLHKIIFLLKENVHYVPMCYTEMRMHYHRNIGVPRHGLQRRGGVSTARRASVGSLYKLRSIRSPLKNTSSQKRVGRAEAGSEKYYWSQRAGEETPNPSPVELLLR